MHVELIKCPHYLIKLSQASNICTYVQLNSHKNAQKVEKCPREATTIDEVKCRKKLDTVCLHKSTFVRYYFSSILKIYVRQIKYIEMNIPTKF